MSTIKREYYLRAKNYHPDKNLDADPLKFQELNLAYATLIDDAARSDYDCMLRVKRMFRHGFVCTDHSLRSSVKSGNKKKRGVIGRFMSSSKSELVRDFTNVFIYSDPQMEKNFLEGTAGRGV